MNIRNKNIFRKTLLIGAIVACATFCFAGVATTAENSPVSESAYALQLSSYEIEKELTFKNAEIGGKSVTPINGKIVLSSYGDYTIRYQEKTVILHVYQKAPKVDFSFEEELEDTYAAGSFLSIPAVTADSGIADVGNYADYTITLTIDGTETAVYENAGEVIQLRQSGECALVYRLTDVFGIERSEKLSFTVVDEKIICGELPENIYYGISVKLSVLYGFYRGTEYPVSSEITAPSGEKYSVKNSFIPDEAGTYVLSCVAEIEGETVKRQYRMLSMYATSALFTDADRIVGYAYAVEQPSYSSSKEKGIMITARSSGAKIHYAKTINASALTKDDDLIKYQVVSSDASTVSAMRITMIDARDYTNRVSLYTFRNPWAEQYSYALAEFDGQTWGINNERPFEGIAVGNPRPSYGTVLFENSFSGKLYGGRVPFSFQYDAEERAVYTYTNNKQQLVLDLDDETKLSKPWKGFSGDEIFLEIEFAETTGGSVIVTEIAGETFSDAIIKKPIDDNLIVLNSSAAKLSDMPNGAVEYGYSLPVPFGKNLFLGDIDISLELKNETTGEDVTELCEDYYFKPKKTGEYSAIYSAVDLFGNTVERKIVFSVKARPAAIVIERPLGNSVPINGYFSFEELEVSGGNGNLTVETLVYYNNEAVDMNGENYIFADKTGKIKVVTVVTDEIGYRVSSVYEVSVDVSLAYLRADGLPDSVAVGDTLDFSEIIAFDYEKEEGVNGFEMPISIYVNGKKLDGKKYTVKESGKLTVSIYAGEGTDREISRSFDVSVIADNGKDIEKVFIVDAEKVKTTLFDSGIDFKLDAGETILLPNALSDGALSFKASLLNDENSFYDGFFVRFEDFRDPTNAVVFAFRFIGNGKTLVYINGRYSGKTASFTKITYKTGDYNGEDANVFDYTFDPNGGCLLSSRGVVLATVSTNTAGMAFNGFLSHAVRVSFGLNDQKKTASLILNTVANQIINSASYRNGDRTGPTVAYSRKISSSVNFGDVIIVPSAVAYDVIQSRSTITVAVYDPDDKLLTENTPEKEFTVKAEKYGYYRIVYTATDALGNERSEEFHILVRDEIPPVVEITGEVKTVYRVGDQIVLPEIYVSDNCGETFVNWYVISPWLETKLITESGHVFAEKGKYVLTVEVRDAAYNLTVKKYEIEVI